MRFGKVLQVRDHADGAQHGPLQRAELQRDDRQNQAYASYLRPVEILNARLIKFSWAFDF